MDALEYADCDAIALATRIRAREIDARGVLALARKLRVQLNPVLNAFVADEDSIADAAAAVATGPLAGVPMAFKDCVASVAGTRRDYGSRLGAGLRLAEDDLFVHRLRGAGIVPFGTTNVPEFSSSITTESVLHGACRNPWNPAHSTGGSTGGGAAAVAAGIVPIACANDSAGSIRVPAACCGVFGLRPTRGRLPNGPAYGEIWYGLFSHGVISRSVRDSALVLDLCSGPDPASPWSPPPFARPCLVECAEPLEPLRIAWADGAEQGIELDPASRSALEDGVRWLTDHGHRVRRVALPGDLAEISDAVVTLLAVSLAEEIPALATLTGREPGPDTVERCNRALRARGESTTARAFASALGLRHRLAGALSHLLIEHDVLLTPPLTAPALPIGTLRSDSGDLETYVAGWWRWSPYAALANLCGAPSMSVPFACSPAGLPVGLMFTARPADEARLFRLAGWLERERPWAHRHPPISAWRMAPPTAHPAHSGRPGNTSPPQEATP